MALIDDAINAWFDNQDRKSVRWWFAPQDWAEIRSSRRAMSLIQIQGQIPMLCGLPIATDPFGQPSRLVFEDGRTITIKT